MIVLAALALGPTVVHNYLGLKVDDGRHVASVDVRVPGMVGLPTTRSRAWFVQAFESDDAYERDFSGASGETVRLTVMRSFNAKLLFHHPEYSVAYGQGFHTHDMVAIPEMPAVPVHRLRPEGSDADRRLALYVLRYRDDFVAEPLAFQVRLVGQLLLSGRAPMTLVFVQTRPGAGDRRDPDAERVVLMAALRQLFGA